MTAVLLWAIFIAFLLLVVLAPMVRWLARSTRRAPLRRGSRPLRD